ncbi:MAG: hypothetical protein R3181_12510, partial [Rubricoccaceae bacterium]|nr:hypothetical protein [Rubricoccaceae bacterium]
MTPHDPIRHAYGEAEGPPPAPGEPGYAEYRLLRTTREALDALPRRRPDASALEAVRAAVAAHALGPVRAAYGEADPPAPDDARHAEYAVIRGAKEALDQLPKVRPDAAALDAVTAEGRGSVTAAREGATLAPVRHVYGAAEGSPPAPGDPAYAEYVLLKDTREVLDALPHRRPDASALEAVRAAVAAHALGPVRAAYGEADPP